MGDLKKTNILEEKVFVTDIARGFYNYYYALLIQNEIAGEMDAFALLNACHCLDTIHKLREKLDEDPLVIDFKDTSFGEQKTHKANPLWDVLVKQERMFLAYCKEFGITPASRAKFQQEMLKNKRLEKGLDDAGVGSDPIASKDGDIFDAI